MTDISKEDGHIRAMAHAMAPILVKYRYDGNISYKDLAIMLALDGMNAAGEYWRRPTPKLPGRKEGNVLEFPGA